MVIRAFSQGPGSRVSGSGFQDPGSQGLRVPGLRVSSTGSRV